MKLFFLSCFLFVSTMFSVAQQDARAKQILDEVSRKTRQNVWNYMEAGNQVTISSLEESENTLMDPSSLLTIYEHGFRSKFIGEKNAQYEIELYPDSNEFEVTKIQLFIGKTDKMIKSARLSGTDGNTYGIEIKKMETSVDIPDASFVFNPSRYKDIEVIDFR